MFKFFKKANIEKIKEYGSELEQLREKSNAISINLVGISKNINGLNLLSSNIENFNHKYYAGLFSDMFQKIQKINNEFLESEMDMSFINSKDRILCFIPLNQDIIFSGIVNSNKDAKKLESWFQKHKENLIDVFSQN